MIIFQKVRYKNLLSSGNQFTEVPLNNHKTTLIIGENGAGKSTVLEAISFALYGKPMRGVNKPLLVNSINGKGMVVELEFSAGSKNYLVRRGIKPNLFEIIVDGTLLNQDSASKDYQEMLESQILKLNHKSFCQVDVLSLANYTPFMKLTAAGRREVIEDLLDIQIFSVMNSLLKDRVTQNKSDLQESEYAIKLVENKIELHNKHVIEMNQNSKELIVTRRAQIKRYRDDNEKLRERYEAVNAEILELQTKLAEKATLDTQVAEKISLQKSINTKTARLQKDIEFYRTTETCPTCRQDIDEVFKQSEISKKENLKDEAEKATSKLEASIKKINEDIKVYTDLQSKFTALTRESSDCSIRITSNTQFIASIEMEIVSIENKIVETQEDNMDLRTLQDELSRAQSKAKGHVKEREILSMASQLLKDGGIKGKIIKQYIPIMNQLINKYLAEMDFFVQFNLDETFKETLKSRFRDEFTYDSFSQGEKLRIDLALLFTWRAIAKIRNSSSTNLLFMDEILDSSLDTGGVDEFIKIIKQLTADTNVFIISHRGDQILDKFDTVIRFEKVKSFSRIAV